MSQPYKGLTIPEYPDPADGPAAFQTFVDSGPVPRFANATQRDNAIPDPIEGQVVYRSDIKRIELYTGSSWGPSALPTTGGIMTGSINMNGNPINNLPDPGGSGQAVPLGFADQRYVNVSEAIPWARISGVPSASEDQKGIVQIENNLTSSATARALSANMGRSLNVNKLDRDNPTATGTLTAPVLAMDNGWSIYDVGGASPQLRIQSGATDEYVFGQSAFAPGQNGTNDLGASALAWRNLHYTGSLIKASSARLKTDIETFEFDGLSVVQSVLPKRFRWKDTDTTDIGFIAEDFPAPIRRTVNGINHVVADQLIVTLWQAVRQLSEQLAALTEASPA